MVSFDIASLYTNIPLDETITIILNHLYNDQKPLPSIPKDDMKTLLEFATKSSHFLFDGKIYDQIDGVSMGSPLAPLVAEIFLQDFEKKHLPSFNEKGIFYWKRYVDDTFVLLHPTVSAKDICIQLSQCHPSLKFTVEEESLLKTNDQNKKEDEKKKKYFNEKKYKTQKKHSDQNTNSARYVLPFLDILIERNPGIGFQTQVHRKNTFSGLITRWDSFIPKRYKYNAISTMAYRATKICSTHQALDDEFDFIRNLALNNGYPLNFVESVIRRQLNLLYEPRAVKPTTTEMDPVVLRVPYYGKPSQMYAKRITAAVAKQYPLKNVRVVYDVTARAGQNFTTKDQIPIPLKSGVVYEATCPQCNEKYIGKTCRHLKTRIHEHLSDQKKMLSAPVKPLPKTTNQNSLSNKVIERSNFHMATRSQTRMIQHTSNQRKLLPKPLSLSVSDLNQEETSHKTQLKVIGDITKSQTRKLKPIKQNLDATDINEILKTTTSVVKNETNLIPKSALTKHYVATGHVFRDNDFKILLSDRHRYRLLIKESILIRQKEPKLNGTDRSIPLYIYPDGVHHSNEHVRKPAARISDINMDTGMHPQTFL